MKTNSFHYVMSRGILGALIGVGAGLVLAVLIWALEIGIVLLTNDHNIGNIPLAVLTLPAMCLGSIIGCATGVGAASKEQQKK